MRTPMGIPIPDGAEAADAALKLMVWTSPAFPIGAFAYSHGLEWVVEEGGLRGRVDLAAYLRDLLENGTLRNEAIVASLAWRAGASGDAGALGELNEYALAAAGGRERHLETSAQGNAFRVAAEAAWPCAALTHLSALEGDIAYPVVFGAQAAGHALPLVPTIEAFVLGFVANLVSAAVRLGAIGQTDGQRVTAELLGPVRLLATTASVASLDDLGGAAFRSDIAALQHETQYSRLFRS